MYRCGDLYLSNFLILYIFPSNIYAHITGIITFHISKYTTVCSELAY